MKEKWNAWDVPFYATPAPKVAASPAGAVVPEASATAPPVAPSPVHPGPFPVATLKLADGGARTAERVLAILMALGAILAGIAAAGALLFLGFIASFGSLDSGDFTFACVAGGLVTLGGFVLAALTYHNALRPQKIIVGGDAMEVSYSGFGRPMRVPRPLVRVVTLDDKPVKLFRNNPRFPIAGTLPDGVFADALDNAGAAPWEDLDPERFKKRRIPIAGIWQSIGRTSSQPAAGTSSTEPARPLGYTHDDPGRGGWASGAATTSFPELPRSAYLWSAAGSSLPFLRIGPGDVPNIALLFDDSLPTPRPRWWWYFLPLNNRTPAFRGGRTVRGLLARVEQPAAAEAAFGNWGVVRQITATDVLDEGLLVAKPLTGARSVAYAGIFLASVVVEILIRWLR